MCVCVCVCVCVYVCVCVGGGGVGARTRARVWPFVWFKAKECMISQVPAHIFVFVTLHATAVYTGLTRIV